MLFSGCSIRAYKVRTLIVVVLDKIADFEDEHENEDEYEKYQIRSPESALI